MGRHRGGTFVAALLALVAVQSGRAQEDLPPPQPVPPAASGVPQPACPLPGPPACAPFEDHNGPLLIGDPLLDRPDLPPPGWFSAVELDLLGPHLRNRLVHDVSIAGLFTDTVHLPTAPLDWVAAPRVELGYRFPQGAGAIVASYYGINTTGNALLTGFDPLGDATLRSRLETQVFDLDYANYQNALGQRWLFFWKVGARISHAFFDSQAVGPLIEQRVSNFYFGGGPHVSLDARRRLGGSGFSFFGRAEGAGNIGRLTQNFEETLSLGGVPTLGGAAKVSLIQWVPNTRVMAGLCWSPPRNCNWNFSAGYLFEGWWYLGEAQGSSASLTLNGVFFRGEWRY